MAQRTQRIIFHLVCSECKEQNYTTQKNKLNTKEKVELKKYCPHCQKQTLHVEEKKLK